MSVRSRIALDTESSRNNESKYKESSEVSFIESQGQVLEKDKFNKKILNESVEKIEADLDRLAASRVKALDTVSSKYTDAVREGILVNIDSVNQENDNGLGKLLSGESDDWNSIGEMTPTESDSLITFENKVSSKPSGPRHCSVRMQAGSSNILLDNVVDPYTPILYKSRNSDDPLVHSPRSHSVSSMSSSDEAINKKFAQLRTETQI